MLKYIYIYSNYISLYLFQGLKFKVKVEIHFITLDFINILLTDFDVGKHLRYEQRILDYLFKNIFHSVPQPDSNKTKTTHPLVIGSY